MTEQVCASPRSSCGSGVCASASLCQFFDKVLGCADAETAHKNVGGLAPAHVLLARASRVRGRARAQKGPRARTQQRTHTRRARPREVSEAVVNMRVHPHPAHPSTRMHRARQR